MQLILRAVRCPPGISIVSRSFGPEGGDIGRSPDCALALPDTHRYISRVHAEIRHKDGGFYLKVLSKINPVVVNGTPVGFNEMVELGAGDQVTLGDYGFVAEIKQGEPATRGDFGIADPFAMFDGLRQSDQTGIGPQQDPFQHEKPKDAGPAADWGIVSADAGGGLGDLIQPQAGSDPLLSILGGGDAKAATGQGMQAQARGAKPAPSTDASAVDLFLGGAAAQQSDVTLPGSQAAQADHVHAINLPFNAPGRKKSPPAAPAPAPAKPSQVDDALFDDLLGELSSPPRPASPSAPAPSPEDIFSVLDGLIENPGKPAPQPAMPAAKARAKAVTTAPDATMPASATGESEATAALLARLAEGLDMPGLKVAPEDAPAFMLELGRMFRIAVEGVHALLVLRAEVKKELRAEDRTMIASRENNPLKHTDSIEEALQYLLAFGARNPAFLPPTRAMEDAFKDMRAHELAVMAGMRAGLAGVLKRFDPKALEPRIKKAGALDSVVPALYKAKLWDTYTEFYKDIESEAEDHFDKLFGREFVRAYMEQTKQLGKRGKK